jgi:hypothetical protein
MILDDAKQHFQEMIELLDHGKRYQNKSTGTIINPTYLTKLKAFQEKFKNWTPSIYIYVEGGVLHYANADCNMHVSILDKDNLIAEAEDPIEPGQPPREEVYEVIEQWDYMMETGLKDGTLKNVK